MLEEMYQMLYKEFGPQGWWPAETDFEVILGAILTQQTSWNNVEKAIKKLKEKKLISPRKLLDIPNNELEELIRSSGYYKQKTKKLKNFLNFLFENHNGNLNHLFKQPIDRLRKELLSVNGIGKETADSIILYAAKKPVFVIDAYTVRIFGRIGITNEKDYQKLQDFAEANLPNNEKIFNEFHALIVKLAKNFCKKEPLCPSCPLKNKCEYAIK